MSDSDIPGAKGDDPTIMDKNVPHLIVMGEETRIWS